MRYEPSKRIGKDCWRSRTDTPRSFLSAAGEAGEPAPAPCRETHAAGFGSRGVGWGLTSPETGSVVGYGFPSCLAPRAPKA
jgi:hypothetical protein